ncbi:hypothetical protein M407DRAFT_29441 [Tulasnella calospora MUT 4182]|uniref:Protein kinase domain-containing protein n=1 Tax=Tulasnella calospora MUT 4182 TaxID=1051891 RepID=A0A0C3LHN8_9AGAM|nr:hypothetical protein M407DRAFT_29441 [Tulasnella calospora MUT 4182]
MGTLAYDTIDALTFLHQLDPPVCHGDLKSPNVLVTANYKARLCDFGLARLHEDSGFGRLETSTGSKGSIRWCSPELIDGAPRAPTSDIYAWAWLVWEIMTGNLPYEGTSADYAIIRKIFESPIPEADGQSRLSDCLQLWELMMRCWKVEPGQRPTARMCKTTVTYLPRCTPTPAHLGHQARSAALLESLGDLESWKGNQEKSSAHIMEALRLYQKEADIRGIASALRKQAVAAFRISDWVKLRTIATTALEHCRTLNDDLGIAESSFYLGSSVRMLGRMDEGLPILNESLEIRRTHRDDVGVVQCLERIGAFQRSNGRTLEALSTLDEAVSIASRSGDRLGLANALHLLGFVQFDLSDFIKATEAFSEAIIITRSIGWDGELSTNLNSMGLLKMRLGEYREAEDLFQESISIARRIGDQWGIAEGLENLGECFRSQTKLNEAASALEESCPLWQKQSQERHSKRIASTLVQLKRSQGDWDGVLYWQDHIIAVCRSQEKHLEVADHLEQKAQILVEAQRYDEAALHFEAAIATREENGYSWHWKLGPLCAIPKSAITWERRLVLSRDEKKLQRRLPRLIAAVLKPPTPISHAEPYPFVLDQ